MEFTSDAAKTHSGIHEDQEKDILNRVPVESDPISYCTSIDTETCYSNMQAGFESKDKNGVMDSEDCSNLQTVKTGLSCEYDESSWLMREEADGGKEYDETTSVQESQLPILDSVEDKPVCSKDEYRLETLDIGEHHGSSIKATDQTDGLPSSLGRGISEAELSDVLDKLINEQDIIENISPIVSDFEKETEGNGEEYQKESSNSPREMSDDSDSGSEDICSSIDSDISGDEEVCGTWNPSPLYSYDVENSDEGEEVEAYTSAMGKKNETLSETENEGMNQALVMSETDDESKTSDNDKKAVAQRENVNEMMDELDSLVKQGQIDEAVETPTIQVDTSDIEAVCTVATIQSSFKSDKSKKVFSDNDDNEIHHVHFHSPTNMLFYDPESPIIERVSAEVQNELIDYDDETKDDENEKEISGLVSKTELQAEVVKDLKEVYEKLEAEDEPSDTHEKSDAEAKVTSKLNDQSSDEKEVDISNFSLYKRKLDTEVEEEQVVLRKKNNRNSDASVHRSKILSENECDSMIINELEMVISPNTESSVISQEMEFSQLNTEQESMPGYSDQVAETESDENADMKSSTESMIIHDDDDNRLEESYSKGTNDLKSFLIDNSTSSLDNLVLSTDEKLELNTETKVTDTSQLSSTGDFEQLKGKNEFTGNLSEENNQGIEEKYLSNPESEDIAEVSPFDMSQNDTIVEAKTENYESQNLTHEISDSSDYIPKNSCLESKKIKSGMDESRTIISSGSKLNTNESLYKNEDVHTDIKTPKGKENATQQEEFMEMIQQFLIQVLELIYWKDVKKTGVVFGSMMFILLSLSICSLMSVLAYLSLAVLTVTLSFRVYKSVMQAVQKTNEGHPFKPLLQMDIELREDVVQNAADKIAKNINNCVKELRRLYLVDDYIDSLKFGLLLWLLTYVGAWFDGMTLVILAVISIFTLPKVYETYKVPIDQNVNLIRANLNNIMAQISAKIPLIKKKAKTQ